MDDEAAAEPAAKRGRPSRKSAVKAVEALALALAQNDSQNPAGEYEDEDKDAMILGRDDAYDEENSPN